MNIKLMRACVHATCNFESYVLNSKVVYLSFRSLNIGFWIFNGDFQFLNIEFWFLDFEIQNKRLETSKIPVLISWDRNLSFSLYMHCNMIANFIICISHRKSATPSIGEYLHSSNYRTLWFVWCIRHTVLNFYIV